MAHALYAPTMSGGEDDPRPEMTYEDLEPGLFYTAPPVTLSDDAVVAFATQFDPQPFHVMPDVPSGLFFENHVASGWHTACTCMRQMVTYGPRIRGGMVGLGVEHIRWPEPVEAGDSIATTTSILDRRPSCSTPDKGVVTLGITAHNQHGRVVMELKTHIWVPRGSA